MTYKELKTKSADELKKIDTDLRSELFQLRLKKRTAQLEKTHQLKVIRADIARVQTCLTELTRASAK